MDSIEITSHLEITTATRVDESSEGYRHQSPSPTSTESGEESIAETSHEESLFTTEFDLNGAQYKKTTKGYHNMLRNILQSFGQDVIIT